MNPREGQQRKTSRVMAFEASKKLKKQNSNNSKNTNNDPISQQQQPPQVHVSQKNAAPPPPPPSMHASSSQQPSELRNSSKKKRLDELADASTQQHGENRKCEDSPINNILMSPEQLPEKHILEGVLDILQLRDTHEIFAQPVDPKEVEGYYDFIEEPMDFGTMRAKLHEEKYTTLQQFEHDVFLMFNNAMRFNSSATIYFRQARSLHELATRVFHVLKTDPMKIEHEFPLTRRRAGRKPRGETESSGFKTTGKHRGYKQAYGLRDGRKINCETGRRQTYKSPVSLDIEKDSVVSEVYKSSKQLVPGNGGIGYKESLLRFVKDLGPTAQMVAFRKLGCLKTPSCSVQDSSNLISQPAAKQGPYLMDGVINNISSGSNDRFHCKDAISKGKSILAGDSIDMKDSSGKGKRAFGIGSLDAQNAAWQGKNVVISDSVDSHGADSGGRVVPEMNKMDLKGPFQKPMFPVGEITRIHTALQGEKAHGKAIDKGLSGDMAANTRGLSGAYGPFSQLIQRKDKLNLVQAAGEDTARQSRNTKSWLGLGFPFPGSGGLNAPTTSITGVCGKYKMDQLQGAVMGDSSHQRRSAQNQLPFSLFQAGTSNTNKQSTMGNTVGFGSQSGLPEFLDSCKKHPKSTVYPSKVVKPSDSGQETAFFPGFVSHSLGGMKGSVAPLDLNYAPSSSRVNQTLEQRPQALYDFLNLVAEGGVMQQKPQPRADQYYLQTQTEEVNPLGQGAYLQPSGVTPLDQEYQLGLAQNMQQQQLDPTEVNLLCGVASPQEGFPTSYVQPQPSLLNLLTQDMFVQPEPQKLPPVPNFMKPPPNEVNPLGTDTHIQQGPPPVSSQYMQPLPSDMINWVGKCSLDCHHKD
ncbi:uncharacterized protein LOC130770677 isoform X2 [Actinidia eriantha]|uniref:uncharacterized protein LOC130770677 isoform X2 n=1 Tax=Actinidia eriantha TaxID=165200 RepID=UPI002586B19F|nr:uncharacterized protein LOC130770677 isoform X2 [Actinidia eriantha]